MKTKIKTVLVNKEELIVIGPFNTLGEAQEYRKDLADQYKWVALPIRKPSTHWVHNKEAYIAK